MMLRRDFLCAGVAASGGLLIGCQTAPPANDITPATAAPPAPAAGPAKFGVYVEISPSNVVTITCPQSEMGQGVYDGLTKIVADELGADWARVEIRQPWADKRFISPVTRRHRTANSDSTQAYMDVLRTAGAAARDMLLAAAAVQWSVEPSTCRAANSRVLHMASERSASFGELAARAATLPVPTQPRLKTAAERTLIGVSTPRKDTPSKIDGSAVFGIDVRLPNMLYACLHRAPAVSSKLISFDRDAVLREAGVVDAFAVGDGVAVVADSTWRARRAAERVQAQFDVSASSAVGTPQIRADLRRALDDDAAALAGRAIFTPVPYDKNATFGAIAAAPVKREWQYEVPFLAHAALEPLCATAIMRSDSCEVWAPSQQPDKGWEIMSQVSGLPPERCRLNVTFLGGGFGRKWEVDFIRQAMEIAKQLPNRPIKLTWTREQDFLHDRYRPAHMARTRVGLDRDGKILAMHSRITGINMWRYQGRAPTPGVGDPFATGLLINDRYAIPKPYVDHVATQEPIPVGTWRSVSQSMNCFFSECAIDDIAAATRRDPVDLRRELLAKDPRGLAVIERAAELSGWSKPLPKSRGAARRGRGIAFSLGFGSYNAQVVEVTMRGKAITIDRILCVFDCGLKIDPRAVDAQVVGGIVWGLSATRDGQITFADGAAQETNFHTSPILRINELPPIEVHLVDSEAKPGGCGETSVPTVAPALANAIFAATGRRPRRLPLIADGYTFS